jgi:hypothetical protein
VLDHLERDHQVIRAGLEQVRRVLGEPDLAVDPARAGELDASGYSSSPSIVRSPSYSWRIQAPM